MKKENKKFVGGYFDFATIEIINKSSEYLESKTLYGKVIAEKRLIYTGKIMVLV